MFDDENISTTLAYTKSPKAAKRTTFQDELQKAVTARVARQPALQESEDSDYSDEFEGSDDDDILKNYFNKTSTSEALKRTISNDFLLSDDDDDEEEMPQKTSFLKNKTSANYFGSHELEHKPGTKTTQNQDHRPESGEQKSFTFSEHQKENGLIHQFNVDAKPKPIPKPRDLRSKSPHSEGIGFSASDGGFKPTPPQRSILKKSKYAEEPWINERNSSSRPPSSLSASSSWSRFNDIPMESRELVETVRPEGHRRTSPPSLNTDSKATISPTEDRRNSPKETFPIVKAVYEENGNSQAKDDGKKSPSVLELTMATIYEQAEKQMFDNPPLESGEYEAKRRYESNQKVEQDSVDSSEPEGQEEMEQHNQKTIDEKNLKNKQGPQDTLNSQSTRSLNSSQNTKKSRSRTSNSAKSRYLGTLTLLDNKQMKSGSEPEAADILRATVYQDWLEKKKLFLQELQKIKKMEKEKEREKQRLEGGLKKEEAITSFEAWKALKTKELKKNLMRLKEEEEKKRKELESMAEKKEESKKAVFERWREDKEEHLKEKIRKMKQEEMEKKRKEEQAVSEKKKESVVAFSKWTEKKEDVLKSLKKKELLEEKEKKEKERAEKELQEKKAIEEYERWLEKKERRDKIVKKQKKLQVILEDDPIPPWSPPGRTVPVGK